jgi:hypothetical protein
VNSPVEGEQQGLAQERVELVEERRKATEAVLWQLPSISIAAQSFLLAAGLNPMATDWARILVGTLGMFAALATGLVVVYQSVRLTVLTRWLHGRLGWSAFAEDLAEDLEPGQLNRLQRWLLGLKGPLEVWGTVLVGFVVADAFVLSKGLGASP